MPPDRIAAPRRPTIVDVARQAGVSPATVSNAITGARRVDGATRERIDAAIAALGYVPNLAARQIRTGRANTIAVFSSMPAAVAAGGSRLGFLTEIATASAVAALRHNVALILVPPVPDAETILAQAEFDGAVLIEPADDDPAIGLLRRRGKAMVAIGAMGADQIPHVDLDYAATARLMLDHLHAAGARRFPLLVGTSARASYRATGSAYVQFAERMGMAPTILEIPEEDGEDGAERRMRDLLSEFPGIDGVLVPVDAFATGTMRAIRAAGLSVPDDIRVVTRYDGLRAREERPALTAVNLHLDRIADLAIDRLVQEIAGTDAPHVIPAPEAVIVPRASTGRSG